MLKLRKILLCNYFFIIIFLFSLSMAILRTINLKKELPKNNHFKIIHIKEKDDKLSLKLKNNNHKYLGTYYLKDGDITSYLSPGDTVKLSFEIKDTLNSNFNKYLNHNNYHAYLKIKDIKLVKKNKNIFIMFKNSLNNYLKTKNNYTYLKAFIMGDNIIDDEYKNIYSKLGISHLFAISGMHISVFGLIILKISSLFTKDDDKKYLTVSIFLLIYMFIASTSASLIRASIFYIVLTFNKRYYFYIESFNALLLSVSLIIIFNPFFIYNIGFIYGSLISFTLCYFSNYLSGKKFPISIILTSLISFLVSIPITLYLNNDINLMTPFINLFFIPLVASVLFPLMLLSLILPLDSILTYLIRFLEYASKLSLKFSYIITFKQSICFLIIEILLIIIFFIHKNKFILFIYLLIIFFHYLLFNFTSYYLHMIDVNQGDSFLMKFKKDVILIDTGKEKSGVIKYLKSKGIRKINYLILSHGDFDHMGESINLVNTYKVENVIFNCGPYNNLEKELIKVLDKRKINYYSCINELELDNNKLYFFQTRIYDNENDNSNVIYMNIKGYKFLFMGDASKTKEKDILDKYNLTNIDIFKVGHHGSKTCSSSIFINEIKPQISLISVGLNNYYKHPSKETLDVLRNTKIYRTDQSGSIMFSIKNNKLRIETYSP